MDKLKGQQSALEDAQAHRRFVMNGGNILTLQKILEHTSLAITVR